ncbi:hypothetical protein C479_06172 [Halovivax asiaticus JCM 14624]|uniref:Uncharacterized protein n=1 Tax=Halovivax asiaticus JCM 14624 TaxID=1227490 RepID=M0BQT5_9EURY|nr:hypothetical protein [Halovivax asiaticus]ELZ12009.1 hypothetical protein C479_06172 [Halovivax asiaticus JCM 14624]
MPVGSCLADSGSCPADPESPLVGAESISVDEAGAVAIVDCPPLSRLVASRAGTPSTCMCPATSGVA